MQQVMAVPQWSELPEAERAAFLAKHGMGAPAAPELASDTILLGGLDRRPLSARVEMAPAYAGKGPAARRQLVERFSPQAVAIKAPPALINSEADADVDTPPSCVATS